MDVTNQNLFDYQEEETNWIRCILRNEGHYRISNRRKITADKFYDEPRLQTA